jgi:hypothetical protein
MNYYGQPPISLGNFTVDDWDEYMHYLYLPVRMPGGGDIRLPERLGFASRFITEAIKDYGPSAEDKYVYLTTRRGWASPGNPLNRPGWHADGFGGEDVNYVWADAYPTMFALQTFDNISADHQDSMAAFADQINPACVVTYPDNEYLRIDPYVVHHVPNIPAPGGNRSFLKVSISADRYDLKGNSHNYLFDYSWRMYDRSEVRNDPARKNTDSSGKSKEEL